MMSHGYISGRRRVIRPAGTALRPYQDELIPSAGPSAANVASMFTDCEALLLDAAKKAASCQFLAEGDKTAQNFLPSDCRRGLETVLELCLRRRGDFGRRIYAPRRPGGRTRPFARNPRRG